MKIKTVLALLVMITVALFSVQNADVITVRFLFWHFALSQALVILLSAVGGTVVGLAVGTLGRRRRPERPKPVRAPEPADSP